MTRSVVIFEDHTLENFHPVALSTPVYEIRRGMFNLRERVELVLKDLKIDPSFGSLLGRDILSPLHNCDQWAINPRTLISPESEKGRFLWLNGRSIPDFSNLSALLKGTSGKDGFLCFDDLGLVAADLNREESLKLLNSWHQWMQQRSDRINDPTPWNTQDLLDKTSSSQGQKMKALAYIWDIVPATADLLKNDVEYLKEGRSFYRNPFGLFPASDNPNPFWLQESSLKERGDNLWLAPNVQLSDSVAIETSNGPVILDRGVKVMPFCYLEGPLYVGPGSIIKAGAAIYGESSFGIGNRLAGEIGESTFGDFSNKQHDGFIGHAVLGSWTNLGAMTTCSDLKNNYGNVRVDLGTGPRDTGLRFVGLMMGDHVKTAIGTLFNTGTCVGFASNVFGGEMPPKYIRNYSWGGLSDSPSYDVGKAIETAAIVMSRRGCRLTGEGKKLMRNLG